MVNNWKKNRCKQLRVYIASPYWDNDPQVRHKRVQVQMSMANTLLSLGYHPFWPLHSYFLVQHGKDTGAEIFSEEDWLLVSMSWISACDLFLRIPGDSVGADAEETYAREKKIPVYYSIDNIILNRKEVIKPCQIPKTPESGHPK